MISHEHKLIFIHIPKCAGSSIRDFYFNNPRLDWRQPNYDVLYGWCPKRRIHLQHATSKQLLELDLVQPEVWNSYFKFAFVRNPYDRAYSDYLWIQNDRCIKGNFRDYITRSGPFRALLRDRSTKEYRGDHLLQQSSFFNAHGVFNMDFLGRFETLEDDVIAINKRLGIEKRFDVHKKRSAIRKGHYSCFYTNTRKKLVDEYFWGDIKTLHYSFEDQRTGFNRLKKWL